MEKNKVLAMLSFFLLPLFSCNDSGEDSGSYYQNDTVQYKVIKYPNGNIKGKIPYIDGIKNGIEKDYYEDGTIESEVNYENGKINGIAKWYHPNGKLKVEANYLNGLEHGEMRFFYADGSFEQFSKFENGKHVYKREYDKDGQLISATPFVTFEVLPETLTIGNKYDCIVRMNFSPEPSGTFVVTENTSVGASSDTIAIEMTLWKGSYSFTPTLSGFHKISVIVKQVITIGEGEKAISGAVTWPFEHKFFVK